MKHWWVVPALLAALACPLSAQTGSWRYQSMLFDKVRNIPLAGVLVVEFKADSTWRSQLATDDGSGEWGRGAINHGLWRIVEDPFGGDQQLCVKWIKSQYVSCFTMQLTDSTLHWSGMDMDRLSDSVATKFFTETPSTE